jgi:hypothetical protein
VPSCRRGFLRLVPLVQVDNETRSLDPSIQTEIQARLDSDALWRNVLVVPPRTTCWRSAGNQCIT